MLKTLFLSLILSASAFGASFSIDDYGAVPNDSVSDTSAFRQAMTAAEAACGGTILIPRGEFLLTDIVHTSLYSETSCGYVPLEIRGETGAEVRIAVGVGNTAFLLTSLISLQIRNITFIGSEVGPSDPLFTDAKNVIHINGAETAVIDNCRFYSLGITADGAIIRAMNTKLEVTNSQFNGNAAYAHLRSAKRRHLYSWRQ